ncbi:MAG: fibronectin type III domain-containing protein [Thermoplasmata archaeon]|nr:fibronectin type III domain-containing protein [Thermoplasmata archaeon]
MDRSSRNRRALQASMTAAGGLLFAVSLAVLLPGVTQFHAPSFSPGPPPGLAPALKPGHDPITHYVFVDLENRAFDSYFGTYCPTVGTYCTYTANGIPAGTCIPKVVGQPTMGCVKLYPYPSVSYVTADPAHTWASSHTAYDNGSMDGFYAAENQNLQAFGYYNQSTLPTYWDIAEEYGLGDNWFSSTLSFSLPNHWNAIASAAPPIAELNGLVGTPGKLTGGQIKYLGQANHTKTIESQLVNSTVSWKYYDYPLPSYSGAFNTTAGGECRAGGAVGNHSTNGTFNYWNPFAAQAINYNNPALNAHFVKATDVYKDLANGTLPNVSWVLPNCQQSDHPPEPVSGGQSWVASLIDALGRSPDWNTTAMFVTWDEYGGFYDHVAPKQINSVGLGFRVPLLVISPYSRPNYIDHRLGYFQSFLHLVEWRFGMRSSITGPIPLEYFDFNASRRTPLNFSGWPNDTYPMVQQPLPHPAPPTGVGASAGSSAIDVYWESPVGGAPVSAYQIVAAPRSGGSPTMTFIADGATNNFTMTGLAPGVSYQVTVTSLSAGERSAGVQLVVGTRLVNTGPTGPVTPFHSSTQAIATVRRTTGDLRFGTASAHLPVPLPSAPPAALGLSTSVTEDHPLVDER